MSNAWDYEKNIWDLDQNVEDFEQNDGDFEWNVSDFKRNVQDSSQMYAILRKMCDLLSKCSWFWENICDFEQDIRDLSKYC